MGDIFGIGSKKQADAMKDQSAKMQEEFTKMADDLVKELTANMENFGDDLGDMLQGTFGGKGDVGGLGGGGMGASGQGAGAVGNTLSITWTSAGGTGACGGGMRIS
ncbi:MAG: hypothetical protein RJA99_3923 [Pseudomonadota bacterium]|jgi:hypothetical protein